MKLAVYILSLMPNGLNYVCEVQVTQPHTHKFGPIMTRRDAWLLLNGESDSDH